MDPLGVVTGIGKQRAGLHGCPSFVQQGLGDRLVIAGPPQLTTNPAGIIEPYNTHTDGFTYFFRFLPERV
jgi:hypothetical protein